MNLEQISHNGYLLDCYPRDEETLIINLRTGKDIKEVYIYSEDPFVNDLSSKEYDWINSKKKMKIVKELQREYIWSISIKPKFKRIRYYFEISDSNEKLYLLADDFYKDINKINDEFMIQKFIYPWINSSDINKVPQWVPDTIWYQIFPERFCRGNMEEKRFKTEKWECKVDDKWKIFYGGDLKGIESKLSYISDLGFTGIYLNPIMMSNTNHKYNTIDYMNVDSDFGSNEDIKRLVDKAHKLGIKVMIDAVFNHCGSEFEPWKDVVEKGEKSKYYNWFFINEYPFSKDVHPSENGDYFTFSFVDDMPKLNTNEPEVINYFINIAKYWVEEWKIDGIRFDVGNEISHNFIKRIHYELKNINPDLFLLGEIWHNSFPWLMGDEYDSVMNYPLLEIINNYWLDLNKTSVDFKYMINKCYSLYYEQVNNVLFNILDSHDTTRLMQRCNNNEDVFFQQITVLLTMQGTPCIYYGTEVGMTGKGSKENRKCMPWDDIEAGRYNGFINELKELISIRKKYPQTKSSKIKWYSHKEERLIHYCKSMDKYNDLEVYINTDKVIVEGIKCNKVLYSRGVNESKLMPGGIMIQIKGEE